MGSTADSELLRAAMRRAVALAARGLGRTRPNPVVGCVILDARGRTAGEGWHQEAGGPHAEIHALAAAGEAARGGTAVVTLEPCRHTGRTGPCVEALIGAGVTRVVYAVADPSSAAGGGGAALTAAGITAEAGLLAAEAEAVNAPWLTYVRDGRCHVHWKYAATLDGRSAAADTTSRWITSPEARADVHRLRAEADVVMVGSGTQRADDPHLAARGHPRSAQPVRAVLDTEAKAVRPGARLLDDAAPTVVLVADDLPPGRTDTLRETADVLPVRRAADGRGLDPRDVLAALAGRGLRAVLLEGGPTLAGAFAAAGCVDRVTGYLAPALLGAGPAALGDAGISTVSDALRLDITDVARLGPDLRVTALPRATGRSGTAVAAATASEEH